MTSMESILRYLKKELTGNQFPKERRMKSDCRVAVVVPFYNEENHLHQCLTSLINQKNSSGHRLNPDWYEIICVDNNSSDKSNEVVHRFAKSHSQHTILVAEERRRGPGWARKRGIDLAIDRFIQSGHMPSDILIAWIDADTEADEFWLTTALSVMQDSSVAAAAGDKCYSLDVFESACRHAPHSYLPGIVANEMNLKMVEVLSDYRTPRLNGANSIIRAEPYVEVGGMKQLYHNQERDELAPGEEYALAKELVLRGYRIDYIPVNNFTSGRRVVESWIKSIGKQGPIRTYEEIFEPTSEIDLSERMHQLSNIPKQRWKELFVSHIDACIKNLVTRDVVNGVTRGMDVEPLISVLYGPDWRSILLGIQNALCGIDESSSRWVNGFSTNEKLEVVVENVFRKTKTSVWNWLWRSVLPMEP